VNAVRWLVGQPGLARCAVGALTLSLGSAACSLETRGPVLFETLDAGTVDTSACADTGAVCATAIGLTGGADTELEGSDSGTAYADLCPDEQVLLGYAGTLREISATSENIEVIGSLEGVCGQLAYDESGAVLVSPLDVLPTRGEPRGAYGAWTRLCPTDHALVAVEGRAGLALDQLILVCARWQHSPEQATLARVSESRLTQVGGDGGKEIALACPAGQLARGHQLRAGRWIDAFGLSCGMPRLASSEREP
jgi:hypothetical protein